MSSAEASTALLCTTFGSAPEWRSSGLGRRPWGTVSIELRPAEELAAAQLQAMAELFSAHYGVWGKGGPAPGARVRLSAARLRASYLPDGACFTALATDAASGEHVGHATYRLFPFQGGLGMWVSQLVVHRDWRGRKVASQLLGAAVAAPHNLRACGLASSHPHAVRAMEKAVGARCSPAVIADIAPAFLAASGVAYVQGKELRIAASDGAATAGTGAPEAAEATQAAAIVVSEPTAGAETAATEATVALPAEPRCTIDTAFFVDHSEVDALRVAMPDWQLGPLADGEEFLAIAVRP